MIRVLIISLLVNFWAANAQPVDHRQWTDVLQAYVSENGAVDYKGLQNNAFTIQLILENFPIKSIKDLKRPWGLSFIKIDGEEIALNIIEHEILRPMGDPRIHFAIVCASKSCPKLLNYAYESETLDQQLEHVSKMFINDPSRNSISQSNAKISKIFKWYKTDFPKSEAFIAFLNNYSTIKILAKAEIDYLNYSWNLNE